jgi:heme/copper-type cytochrome/quinol oxidase subunit 2
MSKESIITLIPALIMLGFAIFGVSVISSVSVGGH